MSVTIRILTRADAGLYQQVRLRALQEHPEAFGSSYESEALLTLDVVGERLETNRPASAMFGAWSGAQLVGTLHFDRNPRPKTQHRAMLGAMYVAPEARGQQIGRALLDAALAHARSQSGIRQILLAVTVGNHAARHLYRAAGFVTWGIEPDYLCIGDQYYDIEWMIQMIDR